MKKLKSLVSLHTKDSDFQIAQASAAEEAAHKFGVDAEITFADNNAVNQSTQILKAVQNRPRVQAGTDCVGTSERHRTASGGPG